MALSRSLRSPKRRTLRKKRLFRLITAFFFAFVSIVLTVIIFFNSHYFRISSISVNGTNAVLDQKVQSIIYNSVEGDYFWFIPKDSFFFFPSKMLSHSITMEFPSVSSISFSRHGLTSMGVSIIERQPYTIVCLDQPQKNCYYSDEDGIIYETASSTKGALLIYNISLPLSSNPIGINFIDSGRLHSISTFVAGLARLGLIDDNITISSGSNYDFSLEYQKNYSLLSSTSSSSSIPILHLVLNENRPFSETLENFSAFWQEYILKATSTKNSELTSVDMRYGDNIIYKTR